MDYELSKKLKDAGFPFKRIEGGMCCDNKEVVDFNPTGDQEIGPEHFFLPTLEELINACGENFVGLLKYGDIWRCQGNDEPKNAPDWGYSMAGKTPSEAVAEFWLAINKKQL